MKPAHKRAGLRILIILVIKFFWHEAEECFLDLTNELISVIKSSTNACSGSAVVDVCLAAYNFAMRVV